MAGIWNADDVVLCGNSCRDAYFLKVLHCYDFKMETTVAKSSTAWERSKLRFPVMNWILQTELTTIHFYKDCSMWLLVLCYILCSYINTTKILINKKNWVELLHQDYLERFSGDWLCIYFTEIVSCERIFQCFDPRMSKFW